MQARASARVSEREGGGSDGITLAVRGGWKCLALLLGLLVAFPGALPGASAEDLEDSVLYRAMRDEMERGMARLQLEDLQKPYYLEYTVRDSERFSASASFGALVSSYRSVGRRLTTDLRVGDYVFDNTNFSGGRSGRPAWLVEEDDYDALRHGIWLATDRVYKSAVEVLARKQAVVKTRNLLEQPDDFTRAEPNQYVSEPLTLTADRKQGEEMVKRLSAVFREYPALQGSSVSWSASVGNQYFINSEGSQHRWGEGRVSLRASAHTQADDGMRLSDSFSLNFPVEKGLPPEEEMVEKIRELAVGLTEKAASPSPEDYTGPVLLTEGAAGRFFEQVLVQNLTNPRTPLFESEGRARGFTGPRLVKRLGKRILPKSFEVVDDPTIDEWEGNPLLGWYPVDDEGLAPQKVVLVEGGKLQNLLMSRVPTEKVTGSNGHGRGVGQSVGSAGNVMVIAGEARSEEELKKALLELCEEEDLEYGILVRKIAGGRGRGGLGTPVGAFRVYVEDGREEPARGLRFDGVTVSALRDIQAAGESKHVHHFGRGSATLIAPSVLIEEMELRKPPPQREKRPYLPHPSFPG